MEPDPAGMPSVIAWATEHFAPHVCALVAFRNRAGRPQDAVWGGSATFVRTGRRLLLVTAKHVLAEFDTMRDAPDSRLFALGNGPVVDVSEWESDMAEGCDIAALVASRTFAPEAIGLRAWGQDPWRRPRPAVGEVLFLMGYPGVVRVPASDQLMTTGRSTVLEAVVSVSDRHAIISPSDAPRQSWPERAPGEAALDAGGMSGGAAFVIRDKRADFIGVVSQGTDLAGCFFVAHHDALRS